MHLRTAKWILFSTLIHLSVFWLLPSESLAQSDQTKDVQVDGKVFLPLVFGPPPIPEGTLDNGGVVEGPGGVRIGAPQGSLVYPVEVIFASPGAPTQTIPAPAQAVGAYVQTAAVETTYVKPENPLVLAFPVPSGVDTAHLALGVLSSGEKLTDVYLDTKEWTFLEGLYNSSQELFLTAATALTTEGEVYVLVEHPGFDSPPPAALSAQKIDRTNTDFAVLCVQFIDPSECTPATQDQAATYLQAFEAKLQGELGFAAPRLRGLYTTLSVDPLVVEQIAFKAYLEPSSTGFCNSQKVGGYYSPEDARLVLCLVPNIGVNGDYIQLLLHEYFHATQYGYPAVLTDRQGSRDRNFIIEGMAKAVEELFYTSGNVMQRSEVGGWLELHKVDLSLDWNFDLAPYFAQDFWVYYGQQYGQNLAYLQNILSRGATASDVAGALGSGDYLESYWPWVKNQAMEATNTLDGKLTTPCQLEKEAVASQNVFNFMWTSPDTMRFDVTVPALTTEVVKVQFDYNYDLAAGVVFPTNYDPSGQADMALEYKFYKEGEGGCDQIPDGPRNYEQVKTSDVYFVLITNKEVNRQWGYTVFFEVTPIPGS